MSNNKNVTQVKVVVLGSAAVGKTCLIKRYVDKVFSEFDRYQATIGAVFASKSVKKGKRTVVFNLWDTAGQERFHSMSKLYYRGADVAIVCYDVNDASTFERMCFWVEEVSSYEESCRLYVCGTKKDLLNSDSNTQDLRKVNPDRVEHYVQGIGAKSIQTSSKTGENVDELFKMITTDILNAKKATSASKTDTDVVNLQTQGSKRKCCHR